MDQITIVIDVYNPFINGLNILPIMDCFPTLSANAYSNGMEQ